MGNDDCQLSGNASQKDICFCSDVIPGFSAGNAHVDFEVIDGTFHNGADFIGVVPLFRIPLNSGEHA